MEVFLWMWISIGLIIAIGGCLFAGYSDEWDRDEMAFGAVFIGAAWPAVIAFLLIIAPFFGMYKLGEYLREKNRQ